MPTDKLLGGYKVKASYLMASNILLGISVLSFVLMFGGCFSCMVGGETTYDSQETYYQKSGGSVGYGAKSHRDMDKDTALVVVTSFGVCFVTFIAGFLVRAFGAEDETG